MTVAGAGLYHIYREGEIETVALRGADIVLAPSSWTSLMGPSGSGKSTLLHILAGLLTPTAGSVIVDGTDLTKADPVEKARRRRRIGVVLQRDNLHPGLDVVDNVALPLRLDGRPGGSARERARQLLAEVGLAGYRRRRVGQLSGGESQRVAPWRWRRDPPSCWPTNRPGSSTRTPRPVCWTCWRRFACGRTRRS
ncbi:hypothetical protein GCM10009558_111210 [Virgisporangium aurantiacum]